MKKPKTINHKITTSEVSIQPVLGHHVGHSDGLFSEGLCEAADTQTDLIECYSCEGKGDDNDCLVLSDLNSHVLMCEENVTVCDQAAYLPPGGVLHLHAATQSEYNNLYHVPDHVTLVINELDI